MAKGDKLSDDESEHRLKLFLFQQEWGTIVIKIGRSKTVFNTLIEIQLW